MFKIFNRKNRIERLFNKYIKTLSEAKYHAANNRRIADEKFAESNKLFQEIQKLQQI